MKNRIVVFILAFVAITLFSTEELLAQKKSPFTLHPWRNWMQVDSYNGVIVPKALSLQVQTTNAINQTDWYINVRILDSEIDPSKIRLILNSVNVVGGDPLRDVNYGTVYPLGSGETRIITSNQNLQNNAAYTFIFDVQILGGDHLLNLTLGKTYYIGFMFSVYTLDKNKNVDSFVQKNLDPKLGVRINDALTDIPSSGTEFGFVVNADASLDFTAPEHYTSRVENDPNNSWINVTSKNSSYVITVKTNTPNFELIRKNSGISGDATIPVNVVNVEMQSAGSGTSQGSKELSTTPQTLFIGTQNNNPQKLPVRYFITKSEAEKLATKTSGEYRAILTYTLEPN